MKARLLGVALLVSALLAVHTLSADDAKPASVGKCPVSGKPASADHAVDFDGGKVYLCCENCPAEFAKDTKKFAAKAHLQMFENGQLVQTGCPMTGHPINPKQSITVDGATVSFCCGQCKKQAEALTGDAQIEAIFGSLKYFKMVKKD